MNINLLDLFSGIGGFHLGLRQSGFWVNSYYSEIDKYAIKTYNYNFKNSTYVGSLQTFNEIDYPKESMLSLLEVLGFWPCRKKKKPMEIEVPLLAKQLISSAS